ncbi:hypothetical protein AGDE_03636 [Angomonas deanei]|nr:hypothetical protein AGDE_03636 [Angomonas deanei]|eukprot:EPY40292.1 hypothetical protein AGDE_03636 [Angomonas deanei]
MSAPSRYRGNPNARARSITGQETTEDARALEATALDVEGNGDDSTAIQLMEQALQIRCRVLADLVEYLRQSDDDEASREYTSLSHDVYDAAERLMVKCNTYSVYCFKHNDYEMSEGLLRYCLEVTGEDSYPLREAPDRRVHLRGVTYNNLGCMERHRGRYPEALEYMQESMRVTGVESPVGYMNISAVLLQLNRNAEAVRTAERAVELLADTPETGLPSLVAIAHHNLAMALENVDTDRCLSEYETAFHASEDCLGPQHPTTQLIQRNWRRYQQQHPPASWATRSPVRPLPADTRVSTSAPTTRPPRPCLAPVSRRSTATAAVASSDPARPPPGNGTFRPTGPNRPVTSDLKTGPGPRPPPLPGSYGTGYPPTVLTPPRNPP